MKEQLLFTLTLCAMFLTTSCQFSKGVKQDLSTGLKVSYNGFTLDEAYLTLGEERTKKLTNNKVPLGSQVNIWTTGVENFQEENGKVFPGCQLILTDKNGKELLNLPDLFGDLKGGLNKDESNDLRAKLTTGKPMVKGETYNLKARFFDKKNVESEIVTEVSLVME